MVSYVILNNNCTVEILSLISLVQSTGELKQKRVGS